MKNGNLPKEELKKYGIINSDNSFSKKLNEDDISNFFEGGVIVADNERKRIVFKLLDNNTKLSVNMYERDIDIRDVLEKCKDNIQYSDVLQKEFFNKLKSEERIKQVFIFDEENLEIKELDFIKDIKELTKIIIEKQDSNETNRYKEELQKLRSFLEQKKEQFPELNKEISNDLNIVINEINFFNKDYLTDEQQKQEGNTDIRLNVNDSDLYQDQIREREKEEEERKDQEEERKDQEEEEFKRRGR